MRCLILRSGTVPKTCRSLDICRPVDAITNGFTAAEENREGPEPLVVSEDLLKVVDFTHIIGASIGFSLFVQVLNCGLIGCS